VNEEIKQANLNKAISEVRATAREWYEKKEYDPISDNPISNKSSSFNTN